MKKTKYYIETLLLIVFMSFAMPVSAQTGFEEDVEDVPEELEAPINNWILAAMAGGAVAGYVFLRKEKKAI